MSSPEGPNRSKKRVEKRISTACESCHKSKVKCSGRQPCDQCQKSGKSDSCSFRFRDSIVKIKNSELRRLKAASRELERRNIATRAADAQRVVVDDDDDDAPAEELEANPGADNENSNPVLVNQNGCFPGQRGFVGEGACTAFGDRLLQIVDGEFDALSSSNIALNHPQFSVCNRLLNDKPQLPDRGQANLLIKRALQFIGTDYHLLLRRNFFRKLDEAYSSKRPPNLLWACQLFALLAIGEMYSHASENGRPPGSSFFLQAIALLQDCYEEPSVEQVQSLLLLSFYANVLGRIKSAHVYAGIGIRVAVSLGLHRSQQGLSTVDPVERENRRRVWWTLYLFDRMTASKLGYPLAIQDDDVDVEMPSMEGLSPREREEFAEPEHLCANVRLAKITGSILNNICLPRRHNRPFIQRVHQTLNDLRRWENSLPPHLHRQRDPPSLPIPRGVCSLHMLYHLCIIQTTRGVLFHIYKTHVQASSASVPSQALSFSPEALSLAESCVQAAKNLNQILAKLFVRGELAVFGYFDTHYLFSSTLILIVSVALEPNSPAVVDAIRTAMYLLGKMGGSGNVNAMDYLKRLEKVRRVVSPTSSMDDLVEGELEGMVGRGEEAKGYEIVGEEEQQQQQQQQQHQQGGFAGGLGSSTSVIWPFDETFFDLAMHGEGVGIGDALDRPGILEFLDQNIEWPVMTLADETAMQGFTAQPGIWDNYTDMRLLGLDPRLN